MNYILYKLYILHKSYIYIYILKQKITNVGDDVECKMV